MASIPVQQEERSLVERLQAGDKTACAQCIEQHAPGVYRLALRILGDETEAEDVMQETFLNAFKSIDDFQWRSSLQTWLYRITYNLALMRKRKRQPLYVALEPEGEEGEEAATPRQLFDWCCVPDADFATNEARRELEAAIAALPANLREVFVLRELEGLSGEQAAKMLGLTVANVKVRLHRARLWLRKRLADYFSELAQQRAQAEASST
jgi:RNA polymerase sigma-70 factor (ECF subfamily)